MQALFPSLGANPQRGSQFFLDRAWSHQLFFLNSEGRGESFQEQQKVLIKLTVQEIERFI